MLGVAAIVAETRSAAVDAAEMVVVDYDPLPVVTDVEEALAPGEEAGRGFAGLAQMFPELTAEQRKERPEKPGN